MNSSPSFFPRDPSADLPRAFGRYTMLAKLASGGMADVFLALFKNELGIEKLVVLKCLREDLRSDLRFNRMFLDEARTAASLAHPNIVPVFDSGQVEGVYFMAMEYIEGVDLRHLRRTRARRRQRIMPLAHVLHVIGRVLSGLEYAHDRTDFDGKPLGIVHRDVSPQNVLLEFSGGVKLVDFGVAKSAFQPAEQSAIGQIKGKIAYMSPEQAMGEAVDQRTDLFATGVILYELTTGIRLFKGATDSDTLQRVLSGDYPSPASIVPDYPPGLEAVVRRALKNDLALRYQTARQMRLDLSSYAQSAGIRPSESAFSDWLRTELPEQYAEHQQLRGRVRELADRAPSRSVPLDLRRLGASSADLDSVPPPSSGRRVSMPETDTGSDSDGEPPDSERVPEVSTALRKSAHSIPDEKPALEPRRRKRWRWALAVALLALTASAAVVAGWVRVPGLDPGAVAEVRARTAQRATALFRAARQKLRAALSTKQEAPPVKSVIEIVTGPAAASVWLDGKPVPSRKIEVDLGSLHRLHVTAKGYYPLDMDVRPSHPHEPVHVVLERLPTPPATTASVSASSSATLKPAAPAANPKPARRKGDSEADPSLWRPKGL